LSAALHAQEPPAKLTTFLRQRVGLEPAQLAAIERGDAIVSVLVTATKRDIALFGIVRLNVAREVYVTRLHNFPHSLRTPTRPRLGIFHDPASLADVEGATVAPEDLAELKGCTPGDCKLKIPATDMQRLHAEIDWSAANAQSQVNGYLQRRLVEYVTDYRARGDSALVVYDNRATVRASDVFAALLAQSPYVYEDVPSLRQYLTGYPRATLEGAREVLFWAVDSASGMKPILSVNHLVVYTPPEYPEMTLVASKQIFANHYFEGSFDITAIVDRAALAGEPGIYLMVFRRSRSDHMPTGPMNIRGKVVGKLRDQMKVDLEREKEAPAGLR
jgi:hypothetical protein